MQKLTTTFGMVFLWAALLVSNIAGAQQLPDFTALIEQHSPAVVKITAISKARESGRHYQLPPHAQMLPEIFRELLEQRQAPRDRGSLGSGFIISSDGYVLTNDHVISDMDEVSVVLSDQREFTATVVGQDERSDLALLKIDAKDLPTLSLAKNDDLKVGQWVIAIGSPFGLDYSASAGIVSAIGRSIRSAHSETNYVPFIQTDVAINPGNSGGPLFNLRGEVVGINSQIYSPSGGSVGLSFAIPSALAIDVVEQLRTKGRVDRGWLGVSIQDVDKNLASSFGLKKPQGALISDVEPDSPADKSGLEAGDVVIKFNGVTVNSSRDLPYLVSRVTPDTKVPVVVMRKGKEREIKVAVGVLPVEPNNRVSRSSAANNGFDRLGVMVGALGDIKRNGPDAGVVVQSLESGGPAAQAGLQVGDVITQVAFTNIRSVSEYHKVVEGLPKNEPQAIRFFREGRPVFRSVVIK
ncbi:MAG: Do family serine endopeptidase [Cellvibrio sp.]